MKNNCIASAHTAHCRKRDNKSNNQQVNEEALFSRLLVHVAPDVVGAFHERAGFDVAEAEFLGIDQFSSTDLLCHSFLRRTRNGL